MTEPNVGGDAERYPDPVDQAAAVTEGHNRESLERVRRSLAPQQVPKQDGTYERTTCVEPDCGEELPIERLKMGRIRCTGCQSLLEERNKRYKR